MNTKYITPPGLKQKPGHVRVLKLYLAILLLLIQGGLQAQTRSGSGGYQVDRYLGASQDAITHPTSTSATACDAYVWYGTTYTNSGTYTRTSTNAAGCTYTETLILTIRDSSATVTSATACDSYTWAVNGLVYTVSGTYTVTSLNPSGCLHTDKLILTIHYSTSSTLNMTVCDGYTWHVTGLTYTVSGTYTATSLNAEGCVHTSILNLAVNYSSSSTVNVTACDAYTWPVNGMTYVLSGTYTATYLNALGCVHTATLNLAVNYSTSSTVNVTACDTYTWPVNGMTYVLSGTYTATYLNAVGCTHTATLNLTVNYSSSSTVNVTACDTYTWPVNGMTYVLSGTYTATFLNAVGCVHTATLNLAVNYSSSSTVNVTACDAYTWPVNGMTYVLSGTYTATYLNAVGCTHTATLNLTVNYSSSSTVNVTACDAYTWPVNGVTYVLSGTYTATYLNAVGCVHTATLNLAVNYSSSSTVNVTACDTYTWPVNGMTYVLSGTYTATYLNAVGCVHTATLNLTINHSTSSSVSVTACNSYTWPANNQSYMLSGTYTTTYLNAQGCVHTATLLLTIHYSSTGNVSVTAAGSYTWPVNGLTYTVSGVYSATLLNTFGCDSTIFLNLTITSQLFNLNLSCFLEGYWNNSSGMFPVLMNQGQPGTLNDCDSIDVELRMPTAPYGLYLSARVVLQVNGNASCWYSSMVPGNYYIVVKHRSGLQTWSALPVLLTGSSGAYNFTNSAGKAYGANQKEVAPGVWAFYCGDVNVDENIDLLDLGLLEVDIANFEYGYFATDINGDGNVDLLDSPTMEANINNFIFSAHP